MKSLLSIFFTLALFCVAHISQAQTTTTTLNVPGECGTCKKKIEAAARKGGASYAAWNIDTKVLTVKYDAAKTNKAGIERMIAATGYDTPDFPASQDAYNNLDDCCKYERKPGKAGTEESATATGKDKCKKS